MTETIKKTWNLLKETINVISENNPEIQIVQETYNIYEQSFNSWYDRIMTTYMNNDVAYLDRHKVAGIIIVAIIESGAVICSKVVSENKHFIGQYLVASSVGITYMQDRLNEILIRKHQNPIDKIWMPEVIFSCDVPYFEIFARNLYFSHEMSKWGLNPLDISKELFLLEYITIEKKEIDPYILKEKQKKQ